MTGDTAALYAEVAGTGDPAIVLVHAGIADLRMWDREFATLARDHRVIRFDLRGYGRSPDPTRDYFDHEDLLAVMDAHGVARAVLIGASAGGRVVLDTAVTTPERVRALVLLAGAVPGVPLDDEVRADFAQEDDALAAGDIERAKAINLRWWVDGVDREPDAVDPHVRAAVAGWLDDLLPRQAVQIREDAGDSQLVEPLIRDRLGDVEVPVLVLVGRHDVAGIRAAARHVAEHAPHAELVEIDGAAHLPNLEQPDRVAALLEQFLGSLSPG